MLLCAPYWIWWVELIWSLPGVLRTPCMSSVPRVWCLGPVGRGRGAASRGCWWPSIPGLRDGGIPLPPAGSSAFHQLIQKTFSSKQGWMESTASVVKQQKTPLKKRDERAAQQWFIALCQLFIICPLGVVNSKKLSSQELVSTDFGLKVTDKPRTFPAASIWSCTVASNLENASSLCCSKINPIKISS